MKEATTELTTESPTQFPETLLRIFRDTSENAEKKEDNEDEESAEDSDAEPVITTPRALHLTVSLFVRNVPPKISHYDLHSVSRRSLQRHGLW